MCWACIKTGLKEGVCWGFRENGIAWKSTGEKRAGGRERVPPEGCGCEDRVRGCPCVGGGITFPVLRNLAPSRLQGGCSRNLQENDE